MTDSAELFQKVTEGDPAAIEAMLARHLPGLHAFVRIRSSDLIRGKEQTADMVQSVCREVLQHLERYKYGGEAGFKHWLYETALRKLRNRNEFYLAERRNAAREARTPSDEEAEGLLAGYRTVFTPSRHAGVREELEAVEDALAGLSEDQRRVIALSRIVGLSHAEIATEMGRTEQATRALLHRALATLSDLLARRRGPETEA